MSLSKPMNSDAAAEAASASSDKNKDGKKGKKAKPHQPRVPFVARVQEFFSNVLGLDLAMLFRWAQTNIAEWDTERQNEADKHVKKLQKELRKLAKAQRKRPTKEGQKGMRDLKLKIADAQDQLRNAGKIALIEEITDKMQELEDELRTKVAEFVNLKGRKEDLTPEEKSAMADLKKLINIKKNEYKNFLKQKEALEQAVGRLDEQLQHKTDTLPQPQADTLPQPQTDTLPQPQTDDLPQPQINAQSKPKTGTLPQPQINTQPEPKPNTAVKCESEACSGETEYEEECYYEDPAWAQRTIDWVQAHKSPQQVMIEKFIRKTPLKVEPNERTHYDYHACDHGIHIPSFSQRGAAALTKDQIALKVALLHKAATGELNTTVTQTLHDDDIKWRLDVAGKAVVMHHGRYTDLVLAKDGQGRARPVLLMLKSNSDELMPNDDLLLGVLQQYAREGHSRGCVGVAFLENSEEYHHAALVLKAVYT